MSDGANDSDHDKIIRLEEANKSFDARLRRVESLAYGALALIGATVLGALIALVLKGGK